MYICDILSDGLTRGIVNQLPFQGCTSFYFYPTEWHVELAWTGTLFQPSYPPSVGPLSATSPLVISRSYWKCFIVIFHSKHWTYQRFCLIMLTYVNRQYLFISPFLSPNFPQWISINIALNRTLSAGRHACTAQVSVQMQRRHHRAAALARRRWWTWR